VTGYLLDTNVLSEFARAGAPDPNVDRWMQTIAEESLFASVLGSRKFAEALNSCQPANAGPNWTPVTKAIADRWAVLSASAQRQGITLANIGGLIAATAFEHGLTLVARNVKDFIAVELPMLNPWES
jgi:predicted nucleic acid-binding protein